MVSMVVTVPLPPSFAHHFKLFISQIVFGKITKKKIFSVISGLFLASQHCV